MTKAKRPTSSATVRFFKGKWRAKNDTDPMEFFNDQGEPMALKPGNTWIVIAGLNSTYEEVEPNVWELFFMYP